MSKQIVPNELKTHIVVQLIESITESANTTYYAFIGDHVADGDTLEDVTQPVASYRQLFVEPFRNMILGKKLLAADVRIMVKRNDWSTNTVYAMYDDQDSTLFDKNFFISVDEGAFTHVYKCLYNANGAPSVVKPVFADVNYDDALFEIGDNYYETSDGYQWKYMYTVNSTEIQDFATEGFIPLVSNTIVENNAQNGTIDVIKVDSHGRFYNNHLKNGVFRDGDVRFGNTTTYRLADGAETTTNFYKDTILHITSGPGAGQYKRISQSFANNSGVMVVTQGMDASDSNSFAVPPQITSTYEISPEVIITSDGSQTVNAFARAVINANASNSVHRVEILNPGKNYTYATTKVSNVFVTSVSGGPSGQALVNTPAVVRPILPPSGGHGANSAVELSATAIGFVANFSRDESGTVPAENTFGSFGIIRDPLFANIEINFTKLSAEGLGGSDGTFVVDEKIYQIKKIELSGNATVEIGNTVVVDNSNTAVYDDFFKAGDFVYITDKSSITSHFISQISSVTNSTSFITENELNFTTNTATVYYAQVVANGVVNDIFSSSKIYLRDCDDGFEVNQMIIGANTYAVANIAGIDVNERFGTDTSQYTFNTYNQMVRCVGEFSGGVSFTPDEIVYQGNQYSNTQTGEILATAFARVHSSNSTTVSLTRVQGTLNTNTSIKGLTSGAIFGNVGSTKFTKYDGDLDPTKGSIIYFQNDVPVERSSSQSEQVRIILEF